MDDISKLVVSVSSAGVSDSTTQLDALTTASVAAEGATTKLGTAAVTAAQLTKAHSDALNLKAAMQNQDIALMNMAGKAYADAQKEAISLNTAIDASSKAYANAQAAAIIMNASYDAAAASSKALAAASVELAAASDVATKGHGSQASIIRESLVIAHEAAMGSGKRLAGSMMVLANATGVANDVFAGAGVAAEAMGITLGAAIAVFSVLAAAIGLVAYAFIASAKEQKAFADSLILSNNFAGTTTQGLKNMAESAVAGGGSISSANEVVQKLASSGKFTALEIGEISKAAIGMDRAFGVPIDATIAEFETLAKVAVTTTAASHTALIKAVETLDDRYHALTISQFAAIEMATKLGDVEAARAEAIKIFAQAEVDMSDASLHNLGIVMQGWHGITDAINGALTAVKEYGSPDNQRKTDVSDLQKRISAAQDTSNDSGAAEIDRSHLASLQAELALKLKINAEIVSAATAHGQEQQALELGKHSMASILDSDEKHNKLSKASNDYARENLDFAQAMIPLAAALNTALQSGNDAGGAQAAISKAIAAHQENLDFIAKEGQVKQKGMDDSKQLRDIELERVTMYYAAIAAVDATSIQDSLDDQNKQHGNATQDLAFRETVYAKELADLQAKYDKQKAITASFHSANNTPVDIAQNQLKGEKELAAFQAAQAVVLKAQHTDENNQADKETAANDAALKQINSYIVAQDLSVAAEIRAAQVSLSNDSKRAESIGQLKSVRDAARASRLEGMNQELAMQIKLDQAAIVSGVADGTLAGSELDQAKARLTAEQYLLAVRKEDLVEVNKQIPAQKALEVAQANTKNIDEALASGKRFATGMTAAFGSVGTAIGGMSTAILQFGKDQDTATAQYTAGMMAAGDDQDKKAVARAAYEKSTTQAAITGMASLTQAAEGMFAKNTKGYELMSYASRAFHAAEATMEAAKLASSIQTAIEGMAADDESTLNSIANSILDGEAWASAAIAKCYAELGPIAGTVAAVAVAAALVAAGVHVMGGSGASTGGPSTAQQQATQGTGSVLGDATKQSDSINASLTTMTANSSAMLPLTSQMAASLKAMESGITGVATLIAGNAAAIASGVNLNLTTGKSYSSSTTLGAAGLQYGGSVGQLAQGSGVQQYAQENVDPRYAENYTTNLTGQVADSVKQQFSLVFAGLQTSLTTAAESLGMDTKSVSAAVDAAIVPMTNINLLGMTTAQMTTAINTVLSNTMDDITTSIMPAMAAYAQMGEGPYQTALRVASSIEQAQVALAAFNVQAIGLADVVNKQGDIGAEIVQQSLVVAQTALDGTVSGVGKIISLSSANATDLATLYQSLLTIQTLMGDAALNGQNLDQAMITGAGGISQLNADLTAYSTKYFTTAQQLAAQTADMTASFAKLGDTLPATRDDFVALVNAAAALGTSAGDTLFGQLMALASGFDTLQTSMGNVMATVTASTVTIASATNDLQTAYNTASQAITTTITNLASFAQGLQTFKDGLSLGSLSTLTPAQQYQVAQAQYNATLQGANAGNATDQAGLQNAATAFLTASQKANASGSQYQADFAKVQGDLANAITSATGSQTTAAQQQQASLDSMVNGIVTLNTGVLDVSQAIEELASVMNAQTAGSGNSLLSANASANTAAITGLYNSVLGRAPDAAGLAYWQAQMASGMSYATVAADFANSAEATADAAALATPAVTAPSSASISPQMIVKNMAPANYQVSSSDNAAVVAKLQSLQDELAGLRADQKAQTGALITSNVQATQAAANEQAQATIAAARTTTWNTNSQIRRR